MFILPALLILAGAGLILYALWDLHRLAGQLRVDRGALNEARRLEEMAADLAASAAEVGADLERRTERLLELLTAADQRLAALRGALAQPGGAPAQEAPPPAAAIPAHRRVCELADGGADPEAIAREVGLTRGEVQLILGLRKLN